MGRKIVTVSCVSAFAVAGLAACAVAISASGGLAVFAKIVIGLCLTGSFLASQSPGETAFERDCRECDELAAMPAIPEASLGQGQQAEHSRSGQSHHWRQAVAAQARAGHGRQL